MDKGRGKSGIHLAAVSVFVGMTGKNRHFRDLSQQVLSGVVERALNEDVAKVNEWLIAYNLTLNKSKTEFTLIRSRH